MDDWKNRLIIKSMLPHFAMVGNRQEPRKLQESPQGAIKRKQERDNFQFPDMADGGYPNKIKRPCLEDVTLSMCPGSQPSMPNAELQVPPPTVNPSPTAMGVASHSLLLENNPVNSSVMGSPFVVPLTAEMGLKGPTVPYFDKNNSTPTVDQELQDLLEELTKIQDPSQNELDLEKILGSKPVEPLVLDHPQATLGTTRKPSAQMQHLENIGSSKEFSSGCSQVTGMSLQIPHSSSGISYSIPNTSKQIISPSSVPTQSKNQVQVMHPVALPPLPGPQWHHAHQLKVLAASKQGSVTKQLGPTPSWSALPPPSLSPPYCPVASPHPPPQFSSQSLMVSCMSSSNLPGSTLQGSPNALLSSLVSNSNAVLGPTMSYAPEKLPSPTLNQQPQFCPQSSILANLVSSTIKNPQGHLMSALSTSNLGPSPPYRPEKLSSPGLPQQSFTPQCSLICSLTPSSNLLSQQQQHQHQHQQQQQTNVVFKPMATNSPKTLNIIMQQGLASRSPRASEPFTFGNTKPLTHFISEPGPQKLPSMPATSKQPSLLYYLQQPMPKQASSATASSTATATLQLQQQQQQQQQPDRSPFLLQQMMQQPQRFQRRAASESMPPLPRQTHVDKACKLWEASPPQVSLGRQPPSCQALGIESFLPGSSFAHELARVTSSYGTSEAAPWGGWDPKPWRQVPAPLLPNCDTIEKQRSGLTAVTPEQRSAYITEQMSQFQAIQEQVTSRCGQTKASPPSSQHMMSPRAGLLQNNLNPGMIPPSRPQSHKSMISRTLGNRQGIFNSSPPFPIPSRSGQDLLGSLSSVCQHTQMPKVALSGVPLPRFCPTPLGSQPLSPHQLKQPCMPRMSTIFNDATWAVVAAVATTPVVLREPPPSQVDNSIQQHFDNNLIFTKAPMRLPVVAPACPSQPAVMPPNQGAPGGRPHQKVHATLANPSFSLIQSPVHSPVPVLNATKSLQQGIANFDPMSPIQGIEPPPSYVAAAATATAASATAVSQSPGPFNRMGFPLALPPYDLLPQPEHPLNDLISPPDCSEVDFIETLLKGPGMNPDEDWVCNLRLIDDILQQHHASSQNATAKNAGQVTQNSQNNTPNIDITLGSDMNP